MGAVAHRRSRPHTTERWRRWKRSWRPFASAVATPASSCAATAVLAGKKSWPGVRGQKEVYYCLGLAKNSVLIEQLGPAMAQARARHCLTGAASVREFTEFDYRTHDSWSRARRVIGKAEVMKEGENPRFIVTNLPAKGFKGEKDRTCFTPQRLYEELYCARGDMENLLKQQVLELRADRMSTHHLASNQFRLWEAMFAYLLLERLRTQGLSGTELERATAGSLRLKLLKLAAQVRVSVRRVYVQLSSAYPLQELFRLCQRRLHAVDTRQRLKARAKCHSDALRGTVWAKTILSS